MYRLLLTFSILIFFNSCQDKKVLNAQDVINKSIEVSGGEKYKNLDLEFDFRGNHYKSKLDNGNFEYSRILSDTSRTIIDYYGNIKPFKRHLNNTLIKMNDSLSNRIENVINSVNYFVLLPYGLNDAAVNKKYLEKETINNKDYHKIQITFSQDGGGKDFEDIYVYWFNSESYNIDYFAYSYMVNGGGMRFREAYNVRTIKGLKFVDYNNYKPENKNVSLFDLGKLFENKQLKFLSKIETENIIVN